MQFLPSTFNSNSDLLSTQALSSTALAEWASSDGSGFDNVLAQAMADSSAENV